MPDVLMPIVRAERNSTTSFRLHTRSRADLVSRLGRIW